MNTRHGGKILVDQLLAQGVKAVFTVPGESFLAALDGLYDADTIETVICRQEGGASMMAEAWGKLTGRPGICMVTRGPGLANAMAGLHIAQQDSTPMLLLLGMPRTFEEDREAFQEIETKGVLSTFVKWAAVIRQTDRIPEYVSRAFHVACSGRPGPVVLGLPEDMLSADAGAADARTANVALTAPADADMAALADAIAAAERPLVIVGGPGWSEHVRHRVTAFAERFELPVACAFRYQDYVDNRHPNYAGCAGIGIDAPLKTAIVEADLLIVIGARMGEMTTSGYTLLDIPNPRQRLVHVHPDPDEIGTVYRADIAIAATADAFSRAIERLEPPPRRPWASRARALHAAYELTLNPVAMPGQVSLARIIEDLNASLPEDTIVCNGAGNYAAFVHRHFAYKQYRTQLAPTSGSMGYGLPAAIAAQIAHPDRTVVAFAGDGCFMMTCQELATAVQYDLPVITIVVNNGMYGTIRMHQERSYPGRVSGTTLVNPDFAAMARAFGAHGETVIDGREFSAAFARARASRRPALIEVRTDPEALTPRQTMSDVRGSARS